jgi:hypothetical protein
MSYKPRDAATYQLIETSGFGHLSQHLNVASVRISTTMNQKYGHVLVFLPQGQKKWGLSSRIHFINVLPAILDEVSDGFLVILFHRLMYH